MAVTTLGWDIGGVNTKLTCVREGRIEKVLARAFEIQWQPNALAGLMRAMLDECGAAGDVWHAVTMTAELSQAFRTKHEGVGVVLDAVEAVCGPSAVHVYAADGRFLSPRQARIESLAVAAANWAATARLVATHHPTALLIDIGSTSTDLVPLRDGRVDAHGWTDPARLACGELVYTGVVRTPVEAIAGAVPYGAGMAAVSAEAFALAGDVYVWLGELDARDYTARTPDRRPPTRIFAGERLARAICADRELLEEDGVTRIARALAASQVRRIGDAIAQVRTGRPYLRTAVVTGLGAFVAARAAAEAGLDVVSLADLMGDAAARCAPAAAVALLLEARRHASLGGTTPPGDREDVRVAAVRPLSSEPGVGGSIVTLVVKVGGGLLAAGAHFGPALRVVADAARRTPLLVIPGGGPFADAVRATDAAVRLSDDAAHWMAVLAMDQYAHLLADQIPNAIIVRTIDEISAVIAAGQTPVLAPSAWMREEDPLPHTWDVTSDTIAAWVAGRVGASRLVLVKPAGARGESLVDPSFARTVSRNVSARCVAGDDIEGLRDAIGNGSCHR